MQLYLRAPIKLALSKQGGTVQRTERKEGGEGAGEPSVAEKETETVFVSHECVVGVGSDSKCTGNDKQTNECCCADNTFCVYQQYSVSSSLFAGLYALCGVVRVDVAAALCGFHVVVVAVSASYCLCSNGLHQLSFASVDFVSMGLHITSVSCCLNFQTV